MLCTNADVFNVGDDTTVLQLRSSARQSCDEAAAVDVAVWAQREGFSRVVILAGADALYRSDTQLRG
jgi:hypothetical protein